MQRTFELNNIIITEKNANTATIKFNNLPCLEKEIVITRPDEQQKLFYANNLEVIKFYNNNTNCFDCFSPEPKPDNVFEYENTFDDDETIGEEISNSAINNWLFNADTIDLVQIAKQIYCFYH